MLFDNGSQRALEVVRIHVMRTRCLGRVSKDAQTRATNAVRDVRRSPSLHLFQNAQNLRRVTWKTARSPNSENTNRSSWPRSRSNVLSFIDSFIRSSHSRATTSNVFPSAALSDCRCALGSIPSATSRRASSRFSCARRSATSGYAPRDSNLSFPPCRYRNGHSRPPVGTTSMKSPRSSKSLYGTLPNAVGR